MVQKKKDKDSNKIWVTYGILAVAALTLYATGRHTDVIGFVQSGILATGLMNPDIPGFPELREGANNHRPKQRPGPNTADYSLELIDREGNTMSLAALKGKVIFLNIWATWCPPCVAEMPGIDQLHEDMGNEVAFVLLSLDEDFAKAMEFDTRKGYGLPIYAPAGSLPSAYQSTAIPTTYIIDAQGYIALKQEGMAGYNNEEFKNFLKSLK